MYGAYQPDEVLGQEDVMDLTPEEEAMAESLGMLEPDFAETVGAVRRVARRRRRRVRPGAASMIRGMRAMRGLRSFQRGSVAAVPPMPAQQAMPGAPPVSEKQQPLPFTTRTFTVADQAAAILTASPQNQFRGERLVAIESPNAGAITDGVIVLVNDIKVGNKSQFVGSGAIPFSTFVAGAFGVRLLLDGAGPGIDITIHISLLGTLATAGAEIFCAATVLGDSIQ